MDPSIRVVVKQSRVRTQQEVDADNKLELLKLADRIERVCGAKCPDSAGRQDCIKNCTTSYITYRRALAGQFQRLMNPT